MFLFAIDRYHEYGIKLPVGAYVRTEIELGGKDPNGILCFVPDDLGTSFDNQTMYSRSSKKSYMVRDVVGKPIGRVQYFLNEAFVELMKNGMVQSVKGIIEGNPTASKKPPKSQKWVMHSKKGGGAVIPCTWEIIVDNTDADCVEKSLQATIERMENSELFIERTEAGAKKPKRE
ncbi:uncharacterized protein LOC144661224 [Oculina patagonica]